MLHTEGLLFYVCGETAVVNHGIERGIDEIFVITLGVNMCRQILALHKFGDSEKRHTLPFQAELTPRSDAVEISRVFELFQVERDEVFQVPENCLSFLT